MGSRSTKVDKPMQEKNLPHRLFSFLESLFQINYAFILESYKKNKRRKLLQHTPIMNKNGVCHLLEEAKCCFVLSTGRCGTKLLTKLLSNHPFIDAIHKPSPELSFLSKEAYLYKDQKNNSYKIAALHARLELIRESYHYGSIFAETNNRITFCAPFLTELFKQSKFIHIVRNPPDFVRSGILRGYYEGHSADESRIVPQLQSTTYKYWESMSQIEKISWLWNETNLFIENFKKEIDAKNILTLKAEDLFTVPDVSVNIFHFLDLEPIPERVIRKIISTPTNVQKLGDFPRYSNWTEDQKQQLRSQANLARLYGYEI